MKSIFLTKRQKSEILIRDNFTCQKCRINFEKPSRHLHIHHKDGNLLNNNPENLITFCYNCHLSKIHNPSSKFFNYYKNKNEN